MDLTGVWTGLEQELSSNWWVPGTIQTG